MADRSSRWAIVASLVWVVLAAFTILGTHTDVVAEIGAQQEVGNPIVRPAVFVQPPSLPVPPLEEC